MRKGVVIGIGYAFVHFSVEVASFFLLFSRFGADSRWWVMALLFDALAFLPQSIFGVISDKHPKLNMGVIGCLLMIISLIIKNNIFSLVTVALGNALIHINGAQHTLRGNDGKITPNAIFIGAGSFGVITGQLLGKGDNIFFVVIPLVLLVGSGIIMCIIKKKNDIEKKVAHFNIASDKDIVFIVLCSFFAVAIRGYIAYAIPIEWNKTAIQSVLLFVFMGVGKMAGGILADIIGFRKVTILSLIGGLPFLLAGNTNMVLSLIGVSFFSMTMPVTVAILSSLFPKQTGFAFGITTFGLFVGTAPAFFVLPGTLAAHQITVAVLTLMALPLISVCIKKEC